MTQKEFVIRVQSDIAKRYSLGEKVSDGVAYFRNDNINLTEAELFGKVAAVKRQGGKIVSA